MLIQFICILESQVVVLDGELLYTKILEVNLLFAFGICPVDWREISMKQSVGKCKQINF